MVIKKIYLMSLVLMLFLISINTVTAQLVELPEPAKTYVYRTIDINHAKARFTFQEDINSTHSQASLIGNISISHNKISIDTNKFPEMNKRAVVNFRNTGITDPIMIHNGLWDKGVTITTQGGTNWRVELPGFSEWQIVNNTFPGTHTKTIIRSGNLEKDSDAVGIFSFNLEVSAVNDTSLFSNHADTIAPSKNITACKYGNVCLNFDGVNDYIIVPNIGNTQINHSGKPSYTMSAWVNPRRVQDTQEDWIYSDSGAGGNGMAMSLYTNNLYCYVYNESNSPGDQTGGSLPFPVNNVWHNFGCSVDYVLGKVMYYQDGRNFANKTVYGNYLTGTHINTKIGAHDTNGNFMNGHGQCFQMWNTSLNAEQFLTLNNSASCDAGLFSPVATWKAETYNKTQIDSNVTRDGDLGSFYTPNGNVSGGFEFDGIDDSIAIPGTNKLFHFNQTNFTVSVWSKSNRVDDATRDMLIGKREAGSTFQWDIEIDAGEKLEGNFYSCGGSNVIATTSNNRVNDSKWHHYVALFQTSTSEENIRIYVDGVESSSVIGNSSTTLDYCGSNDGNVVFGARNSVTPEHFYNGTLDEIQLFNRTLSTTEISDIYTNSLHYIYQPTGNYTSIRHNSTDIITATHNRNDWLNVSFGGVVQNMSVLYRAGNCTGGLDSLNFLSTTPSGNDFIFGSANGKCIDFRIIMNGTVQESASITNFTLNSNHTLIYPNIILNHPLNLSNHSITSLTLNLTTSSSNLPIASCYYSLNNGNNVSFTCLSNTTFSGLEGINNLTVYVNDTENIINQTDPIKFTVDTVAPNLTIVTPLNGQVIFDDNLIIDLKISVFDDTTLLNSCWFTNTTGTNQTFTCLSNTTIATQEGSNTIIVFANDTVNNINQKNASFTIFKAIPSTGGSGGGGGGEFILPSDINITVISDLPRKNYLIGETINFKILTTLNGIPSKFDFDSNVFIDTSRIYLQSKPQIIESKKIGEYEIIYDLNKNTITSGEYILELLAKDNKGKFGVYRLRFNVGRESQLKELLLTPEGQISKMAIIIIIVLSSLFIGVIGWAIIRRF